MATRIVLVLKSSGRIYLTVENRNVDQSVAGILKSIGDKSGDFVNLMDGTGRLVGGFVRESFLGFYLEPVDDLQSRAVAAVEKLANDANEGDEWKKND